MRHKPRHCEVIVMLPVRPTIALVLMYVAWSVLWYYLLIDKSDLPGLGIDENITLYIDIPLCYPPLAPPIH